MIKKNSYLNILTINFIIFSSLFASFVIGLEVVLQLRAKIRSYTGGERNIPGIKYCFDEIIKPYGYCSYITHKKDVSKEGLKYKSVQIYIDKIGGRVKNSTENNNDPRTFNNFLIGDSYVQADEIPFDKTIQGLSRNKKKSEYIYGIGVGSWNSNQYAQVVEELLKENAKYNIFVFANDFMPNYPLSSWRQSKRFLLNFKSVSWIYSKIRPSILKIVNGNDDAYIKIMKQIIDTPYDDCSAINNDLFRQIKNQKRTDHLVFAKNYLCWPAKYKLSVDHALNELTSSGSLIKQQNSSIRFFVLPVSISFINEQSEGRKYYKVPLSKKITQRGLHEYIIHNLPFETIDLEPIFSEELLKLRKKCPNCLNQLFLKHDGHFNANAHELIYNRYFK